MKKRLLLFLFSFLFHFLPAQQLQVAHTRIYTDSIPVSLEKKGKSKDWEKYKDVAIACRNTGKSALEFTGIDQGWIYAQGDTTWSRVFFGVDFPPALDRGKTGVVHVHLLLESNPPQFFRLNTNGGTQIVAIINRYQKRLNLRSDRPFGPTLLENTTDTFHVIATNTDSAPIVIDSVYADDNLLQLHTKLPVRITFGQSMKFDFEGSMAGHPNSFRTRVHFFFHGPKNFADHETIDISARVIPNLRCISGDTFHFGRVKRGTRLTATYKMINRGTVTLLMDKWPPGMSCDKKIISPADTFLVSVLYCTSYADSGNVVETFGIITAPFYFPFDVYATGFIGGSGKNLLVPETYAIDVGTYNVQSGPIRREIHYTNRSNVPIVISNVTTGDGGSMVEYPQEPVAPGQTITISFIQDTSYPRHFSRTISLSYVLNDNCYNTNCSVFVRVTGIIQ